MTQLVLGMDEPPSNHENTYHSLNNDSISVTLKQNTLLQESKTIKWKLKTNLLHKRSTYNHQEIKTTK